MAKEGKFLTDDQREYLKGEDEPDTSRAEDTARYRIRKRTKRAIEELALVTDGLEEKDVSQLVDAPDIKESIEERGKHRGEYSNMVAVLQLFYEIHWLNGWGFSDTLRLAIERAHGDPRIKGENPRDLPRQKVNEEEFEFEPALESVETYEEKVQRIREKANNGREALTDEEQLFYIKNILWDEEKELREFLHEQNQRRREQEALDAVLEAPWLDDE